MALQKAIRSVRNGHINSYWRLTAHSCDAIVGGVLIVLSGYADATNRGEGYQPDDRREWHMIGPAFAAVALNSGMTSVGSCYEIIKTTRRPIPEGTLRAENGDLTLPTGEIVLAAEVDESGQTPTIPSEFADAADV